MHSFMAICLLEISEGEILTYNEPPSLSVVVALLS
jgi:hypothetical protein